MFMRILLTDQKYPPPPTQPEASSSSPHTYPSTTITDDAPKYCIENKGAPP